MRHFGKRVLGAVLCTALLVYAVPAGRIAVSAEQSGDFLYEVLEDGTARITEYRGDGGDVTVPKEISGHRVTEIGNNVFESHDSLTSVVIPSSVVTIDFCAFRFCSALKTINLPDSLKNIGIYAFHGCTSLESIVIPDSITTMEDNTFYECTALATVTIGRNVITIGNQAFANCISLTSITIPNSVTTIGNSAFNGCASLSSVNIGKNVTTFGNFAFANCYSLFTISGYTGTAAEEYANANGFAFIALDNTGDPLDAVDSNGDGEISTAEAGNFYLAFAEGTPPSGADVSGDGKVDIEDVLTVYLIASGQKTA